MFRDSLDGSVPVGLVTTTMRGRQEYFRRERGRRSFVETKFYTLVCPDEVFPYSSLVSSQGMRQCF